MLENAKGKPFYPNDVDDEPSNLPRPPSLLEVLTPRLFRSTPSAPEVEESPASDEIDLWPLIVKRMVAFVEEHMYDSNEDDCVRVLTVWSSYLKRLRCDERGEEIDPEQFSLQTDLIGREQMCGITWDVQVMGHGQAYCRRSRTFSTRLE